MNILVTGIQDLLTVCEEQLKDPRSDKVAARRTRASLQNAYYTAMAILPGDTPQAGQAIAQGAKIACICPAGVRDANCKAH